MESMEVSATSLRKLTVRHPYAANPRWTQLTHFALGNNYHTKHEDKLRETYIGVLPTFIRL